MNILPQKRNPRARYVAYIGKPDLPDPTTLNGTVEYKRRNALLHNNKIIIHSHCRKMFNWTMGYMHGADLPAPSGYILHTKPHKVRSLHKQRLGFKHYYESNVDPGTKSY